MMRVKLGDVIKAVEVSFGVAILTDHRTADVCLARQAAMMIMREAGYSMPQIGRALQRDHSTVCHGLGKAKHRYQIDLWFRDRVDVASSAAINAMNDAHAFNKRWAEALGRNQKPDDDPAPKIPAMTPRAPAVTETIAPNRRRRKKAEEAYRPGPSSSFDEVSMRRHVLDASEKLGALLGAESAA